MAPRKARPATVIQAPDLPDLEPLSLRHVSEDGALTLEGVRVESAGAEPVRARRIVIIESELDGVTVAGDDVPGLQLRDVILRGCDLSNVDGREGSLRRVEIRGSRLLGLGMSGGDAQDLSVVDSSLALASFAFARLRHVVLERVDLTEASFMKAQLDGVEFIDCKLSGTDFREAETKDCVIRGTSLDGVIGVDSLRDVVMPWPDVLASAAALANALGIQVESD
ncbi:MAG: pentapeptide repeat-containing protein [Solirubrobacteraceae bacterium]